MKEQGKQDSDEFTQKPWDFQLLLGKNPFQFRNIFYNSKRLRNLLYGSDRSIEKKQKAANTESGKENLLKGNRP